MRTNYTTTLGFTIIKPKGKKARRDHRKAFAIIKGSVPRVAKFMVYIPDEKGQKVLTVGTVEELRPLLKPLGKYRLPGDSPLIHNGGKRP